MDKISFFFEIIGLGLALGDIRNHLWFRKLESFLDSLPENKAWSSGYIVDRAYSFYYLGVLIFMVLVISETVSFQNRHIAFLLYLGLPLLFLLLPFIIKSFNWYSNGSVLGTFGICLAFWGVVGKIIF